MKIRTAFVSNSSSSSFICCVCGAEHSGWDVSVTDFQHLQCQYGHIFCEDKILEINKVKAAEDEEDFDEDDYDSYEVPSERCPVCQMVSFDREDLMTYLLKSRNLTYDIISQEVKKQFANYDEFSEYLKG